MEGNSTVDGGYNYPSNGKITDADLQFLLRKLSSDDREILMNEIRKIQSEVFLTRSLPAIVFNIGCARYARSVLKVPLLLKFKPFPLYFGVGFASSFVARFFTKPIYDRKLQPVYSELLQKYRADDQNNQNISKGGVYEEMRRRNRLNNNPRYNESSPLTTSNYNNEGRNVKSYELYNNVDVGHTDDSNKEIPSKMNRNSREHRQPFDGFDYDAYGYMPGTPIPVNNKGDFGDNDNIGRLSHDSPTKSRYGDSDFS